MSLRLLYLIFRQVLGLVLLLGRASAAKDVEPAFDDMQDRPIRGTSDWTQYDVVLDVAPDAADVAFGLLLDGPGQVWIDDAKFEVVGPAQNAMSAAKTGRKKQ